MRLWCFVAVFAGAAAAQQNDLRQFTLKNGAKLLVVERPTPTVAVQIWFRTGSIDDAPDQRGAAHLIEHLLFNGTPHIGTRNWRKEKRLLAEMEAATAAYDAEAKRANPNTERLMRLRARVEELRRQLASLTVPRDFHDALHYIGAVGVNGSTSYDWTAFYCRIPAAHLKHWALAESQRFTNPTFRLFWEERQIVLEEMRQRIFDSGWGRLNAELRSLAFCNHPYGHPVIGYERDVRFADVDHLREQFRRFYCGANMVIVIVGGVKAEDAKRICEEYLGRVRAGRRRGELEVVEPEQGAERRAVIRGMWAPRLAIAFHRPSLRHHDFPATELLGQILAGGFTSRLYRRLVEKDSLAAYVSWSNRDSRYPDLLVLRAMAAEGASLARIEAAIWDEIERIKKEGVGEEELRRAAKRLRFRALKEMCSNAGLARRLGFYEVVGGSWRLGFDLLRRFQEVTPAEIKTVARKYLRRSNATIVWMERR